MEGHIRHMFGQIILMEVKQVAQISLSKKIKTLMVETILTHVQQPIIWDMTSALCGLRLKVRFIILT